VYHYLYYRQLEKLHMLSTITRVTCPFMLKICVDMYEMKLSIVHVI